MRTALPRRLGLLAAVLLLVAPAAQAFGSQVAFGDNDFVPSYGALVAIDAPRYLYAERGASGAPDDAVYLDVDGDGSGVVEAGDVRLAPAGNRSAGSLVEAGDGDAGAAAVASSVAVLYGDGDGNGRYTAGDAVYLVGSRSDSLLPTTGAAAWSLRLTATAGGPAGSLVVDGAPDLGRAVLPFEADRTLDGGTPAAPEASLGLFNADRSLDPGLRALTPGDHLYLETDATGGATAPGDPVSYLSIRLLGGNGTFGTQVHLGDYDFVPRLDAVELRLVRYEGEGPNATDDVVAVDVDADGGPLEVGDVVLTAGGLGGRGPGDLVQAGDELLLGRGVGVRGTGLEVVYADVDGNDRQSAGDYVYVVGDAGGYVSNTDLGHTRPGQDAYFALRLTATSGGAAGTFVLEGDQDLTSYGADGDVAGDARDQFSFLDADLDGAFGAGDRAYLAPRGAHPVLHALRLHGGPGGFAAPVAFGDDDLVPNLLVDNTIRIVRYNAGGASFEDDVIVLDSDGEGDAIEANDLVLTQGTAARGTFVTTGSGLIGKGRDDGTVGLVYVDVDDDGRYGAGDWAYLRDKNPAGNLVATVAGEGNPFTLRLTTTAGGEAGTFVKEDDVDLKLWNNASAALHALTDVGFLDADGDRRISPGDRVYFTEGLGWVDPLALRLVGDFQARAAPGADGGSGEPGDPDGPDGAGGTPDPGGDPGTGTPEEPAQGGDGKAPGPAAVAVLAALAAAAWRRRR